MILDDGDARRIGLLMCRFRPIALAGPDLGGLGVYSDGIYNKDIELASDMNMT